MTLPADSDTVRGVVLDIEGTTTPVSFVFDVLFPYARARIREFLAAHAGDPVVRDALRLVAAEWRGDAASDPTAPRSSPDADLVAASHYVEWLMDRDRKSTGLKIIQGEIWRGGFESGALVGAVYPDVKPALERWRAAGRAIAIYSSGSATAQRLLFGHSSAGDLTPLIDRYFDTTIGPKRSPVSYAAIASELEMSPRSLVFISDVEAELVAARTAGFDTRLCVRSTDAPFSPSSAIRTLDGQ